MFWKMTKFCRKDPNAPAKGSIVLLDHHGNHVSEGSSAKDALAEQEQELSSRQRHTSSSSSSKDKYSHGPGSGQYSHESRSEHRSEHRSRSSLPSIIEV